MDHREVGNDDKMVSFAFLYHASSIGINVRKERRKNVNVIKESAVNG